MSTYRFGFRASTLHGLRLLGCHALHPATHPDRPRWLPRFHSWKSNLCSGETTSKAGEAKSLEWSPSDPHRRPDCHHRSANHSNSQRNRILPQDPPIPFVCKPTKSKPRWFYCRTPPKKSYNQISKRMRNLEVGLKWWLCEAAMENWRLVDSWQSRGSNTGRNQGISVSLLCHINFSSLGEWMLVSTFSSIHLRAAENKDSWVKSVARSHGGISTGAPGTTVQPVSCALCIIN